MLSKFGLSPNECNVYIFLGKYGSSTAREIYKALKIPRTDIYHLLASLENKGIVSATLEYPSRFSVIPLNSVLNTLISAEQERVKALEIQKGELTSLWDKIPDFKIDTNETKQEGKFQILKGMTQIENKINEMIVSARKNFFVMGSEKDFAKFYHSDSLEHLRSAAIDIKLLTSSSKAMYVFDHVTQAKIRKMPDEIKNLCFIIKDDKELLLFKRNGEQHPDDIIVMRTDSISIIYPITLLFNYVWSCSKIIQ